MSVVCKFAIEIVIGMWITIGIIIAGTVTIPLWVTTLASIGGAP
jgi:hypothetical protein